MSDFPRKIPKIAFSEASSDFTLGSSLASDNFASFDSTFMANIDVPSVLFKSGACVAGRAIFSISFALESRARYVCLTIPLSSFYACKASSTLVAPMSSILTEATQALLYESTLLL